jgi:preprotein translocase subunit SecE
MTAKTETVTSRLDTVKIGVALVLIIAGMAGFYVYSQESLLLRVVVLVACAAAAAVIALQTGRGRQIWAFFHDSQIEVRKVVWPTRQETVQTTGIVIVMVLIFAAILWLLDLALVWAVRGLIEQ